MNVTKTVWMACLSLVLMGCTSSARPRGADSERTENARPDSSMHLRYATGFSVDYFPLYRRVRVNDPWNPSRVLACYYLVESDQTEVPKDGIRIRIPLHRLIAGSCTQYAFLDMLGELSVLKGVCEGPKTYHPSLRKALAQGKVADLGDPFRLEAERCLLLKPDALLMNSYNQKDARLERLSEMGIPVLYDNEWMESDLLARAEWIRFVGCFFGKEVLAETLFGRVERRYQHLRALVAKAGSRKPTVLSGDNFRGTWYLPGGRSYTAKLFADAGAAYRYAADTTTGSFACTFERVLNEFHDADVWVGVNAAPRIQALLSLDERYALLRPVRTGAVYAYTNRVTATGGNDFWERAVARPDEMLSDFIKVFHPEVLPGEPWHYLKKIQ
jgi:iron complex transport system substrate-binding protein